ncbi:MAG: hypothetical protein V3T83_15335 [Acidobacteriota bacterium]
MICSWKPAAMLAVLLALCGVQGVRVQAGGPLVVQNGKAGRWAKPIPFAIDQGPLGHLTASQAASLVRTAVARWEGAGLSSVQFEEGDPLPLDLTGGNLLEYFGGNPIGVGDIRAENPIVFDHDGSVIDLLLGEGSSGAVLGFAGPRFINTSTNRYLSAFAVFNGLFSSSPKFASTVVHEFGHLIGLDHTQVNRDLAVNGSTADNSLVALMYPFALDAATESPLRDDVSWLAWLEPAEGFEAATGRIKGKIQRRSGEPLLGAHVVAVQVDASLRESLTEVVSAVSGFLVNGLGEYELPGLQPGHYVVFIEPLDPRFKGGSSVGPFDSRFDDFPKDYYNGDGESASGSDDPALKTVLTVSAGQTLTGIDLFANQPNLPPLVDAGANRTVHSGQIVQLIGSAEDPDGDSMTFNWRQLSGPPVELSGADSLSASFVAPGVTEPAALVFELSADDGRVAAADRVRINIIPAPGNSPPIVNAGPDQAATKGDAVFLAGSASDADGDFLEIRWRQLSGPAVELDGSSSLLASFLAPTLTQSRQLAFELKAMDGRGGVGTDTTVVTVIRNRPPSLRVEPFVIADAGETVTLQADASDPDGDALTFDWIQTTGPLAQLAGADGPSLSFETDPDLHHQLYAFQVTVSDGGAAAAATVRVLASKVPAVTFPARLDNGDPLFQGAFVAGAVVNAGPQASRVHIRHLAPDGEQVAAIEAGIPLAPLGQMTFLAQELNPANRPGTLQVLGLSSPVQGFFLLGELSSGRLDGVGGPLPASESLFFPLVEHSDRQATWIYLLNMQRKESADVTLRLRDRRGNLIQEAMLSMNAQGSLSATIGELFELEAEMDGYLEVESSQPVGGMELVATEDHFSALPGQQVMEATRLYAPHFFSDGIDNTTVLRLLNLGSNPMQVRLAAFDDSSRLLGSTSFEVEPAALLEFDVQDMLDQPEAGRLVTGYLDLEVSGGQAGPLTIPARLLGAVLFSGGRGRTQASLPLVAEASDAISFLHVAQSVEAQFFQGLVIFNPNSETALIEVEAYGVQGQLTASAELEVPARARVIDLLNSDLYFGPGFDQAGGQLRLKSSLPVFSLSLFGDLSGEFLAAVQGQRPLDEE